MCPKSSHKQGFNTLADVCMNICTNTRDRVEVGHHVVHSWLWPAHMREAQGHQHPLLGVGVGRQAAATPPPVSALLEKHYCALVVTSWNWKRVE